MTLQRHSPKKAHPTGKKVNCHDDSFHYKVSQAPVVVTTSRERRLAISQGSTVALEYPSQGYPEGGQHEARLEIRSSRLHWEYLRLRLVGRQGIPIEGGIEPLGPIEWNRYPHLHKSGINESALGLTSNPHQTGHGFSLGLPNISLQRTSMLAQSRVASRYSTHVQLKGLMGRKVRTSRVVSI